jgi:DNA-binding LacI/PurR family transcriptional regulator
MAMKALTKATIYEVARRAGVSIATVSRALRESDLVTEQTRERVRAAATDQGLRVPEDLAVTGWDDLLAARFAGLTTVRQPMRELGVTAARLLHQRMTDPRPAVRRRVLPTELVVRRSCGVNPRRVPYEITISRRRRGHRDHHQRVRPRRRQPAGHREGGESGQGLG